LHLRGRERKQRAVTPEEVAGKILEAIERNRYTVFTSPDGRILHWLQRKFSLPTSD
jgi:hypothetical protein